MDSTIWKKRIILPIVIITIIITTGVFLVNPVISFVTALQSSNIVTTKYGNSAEQLPNLNRSTYILEETHNAIKNNLHTSFVQAADTASKQFNKSTEIVGGHLGVEQGYLVYEFIAMNTLNYAGYKIIVDAGNGDILSTSDGIQIKNYFDRYIGPDRVHGLHGFMREHGYGHGYHSGSGLFGFGHWKGPWGFSSHSFNYDHGS